ncbi:MAG: hypothetical protein KAY32_10280 [Candidatus Eisenbacteria sp.]|nr:hypothetical protein [Candidatus Eisenbacteria bacterium]
MAPPAAARSPRAIRRAPGTLEIRAAPFSVPRDSRSVDVERAGPRRAAVLVWLLAFLLLPVTAAEPGAAESADSSRVAACCWRTGEHQMRLPAPQTGDSLRLPHRPIIAASLRVAGARGVYRPDSDYRLDGPSGMLIWLGAPPVEAQGLEIRYRFLPLVLPGAWGRRTEAWPETLRAPSLVTPPSPRSLPPGARLEIGGSKTFSLEFGTQRDAKLHQSLDLTLRGQLAESVSVRAVLTDRSTPLQPEGTTSELRDLDQILVEVASPWGALRLGDVNVSQQGFLFLRHQREMEGLHVRAGAPAGRHGTGAFGRGLGRHVTLQFFGEEGKQGPYHLLSLAGEGSGAERRPGEDAVVVAGSERVFLDGVPLRRGEDADYTIDYASGEVWFTPRRGIGAVNEIRIEAQIREGAFDRDYAALAAAAGDSSLALALAWMREGDNPDRSAATGLSAAERESLRAAGDDPDALGGGATPDSLGEYALVEADTLAAPFFLYIGDAADAGAYETRYRVSFVDVGEGEGDYVAGVSIMGETCYAYVGRRRGRFLPGRRLTLPELRDIVALRAGGRWGRAVQLHAEGAFSRYDRNRLSSLDDDDNDGHALSVEGTVGLGALLRGRRDLLALSFSGRDVSEAFSPPERLDPAFSYRRWNASADSVLDGRDRRARIGLTSRPLAHYRLGAAWEGLESPRDFSGRRWHLFAERTGRLSAQARYWSSRTREAGTPGRAERMHLALGWRGDLGGGIDYDAEELLRGERGRQEGESYQALGVRAEVSGWLEGLTLAADARWREDDRWEAGEPERVESRRQFHTSVAYQRGATGVDLDYTRRVTEGRGTAGRTETDLADWIIAHRGSAARLSAEWRGRITSEENRLRGERLRYVGGEAGHYDSLGRYVGTGDYELYYEQGDSTALETRLESAVRLRGRPLAHSRGDRSLLGALETSLFGRVELSSPRSLGALLSAPDELLSGGEFSRSHRRLLRGDLSWKGPAGLPVPRLRWEGRRSREGSLTGSVRRQVRDLRSGAVRWTLRRGLRGRVEIGREGEREEVHWPASGLLSYDERITRSLALELTWSPLDRLSVRIEGEDQREDYRPEGWERRVLRGTGELTIEPLRQTRFEAELERRWVTGDREAGSAFHTARQGWRLTCSGSVRPRLGLSGTLWVRIDREDRGDAVVSGRMEARAYF